MIPWAEDLLDSSCYSDIYSSIDQSPTCLPLHFPTSHSSIHSRLSMASKNFKSKCKSHKQSSPSSLSNLTYIPPTQYTPWVSTLDSDDNHTNHQDSQHNFPGPNPSIQVTSYPDSRAIQKPSSPTTSCPTPPKNQSQQCRKSKKGEPSPYLVPDPAFSTPIKHWLSSVRLPNDEQQWTTKELILLLKKELALDTTVCQTATFVDLLFPASHLPFAVDSSLLDCLVVKKIWNAEDACFTHPIQHYSEENVKLWMNLLGGTLGDLYSQKCQHVWFAGSHDQPPAGSQMMRKPDIILLDQDEYFHVGNDAGEVHWSRIQAFAKVTLQHPLPRQILETVNEKSYLMFLTQDKRCFMVALSFDSSGCFSVTLTDHQGQLRMALISIFTPGRDVALLFLKVLTFLMFSSPADLGLDPSICCDPEGKITLIFISEQEFTVLKHIYVLQALVGHGMKIWMVKQDKKQSF
jgi:hypothetical protein